MLYGIFISMKTGSYFKIVCILLLFFYMMNASFNMYTKDTWSLIQHVNLIFHEAGHVIFFLFGNFIYILGGTLGEILIPLIIAGYFFIQKDAVGTGFGLWWLSTALWSVSIYARDARTQALPLLGGDNVGHDWTNMLLDLGLLRYDQIIGNIFLILSIFTFSCALLFLWQSLVAEYRKIVA